MFEQLHLDRFSKEALSHHRGPKDSAKVVELLAVNRLCAPGSEPSIHELWFDHRRDHRSDCRQIVLALVVTSDGFPLTYEVFEVNRNDASTLDHIVEEVRKRHGATGRVWVFDRGIVSEENLEGLRRRGDSYLVGTPRHRLNKFEKESLKGKWEEFSERPGVKVQLIQRGDEVFVLARSMDRARKEAAMRRRLLKGLSTDLKALQKSIRTGKLGVGSKVDRRLGRIEERWSKVWPYVKDLRPCLKIRPGMIL